jgi:hypothetical protein
MDETANPHDLLEAMKESEDEIRKTEITRYSRTEGTGIRKHKKELLVNVQ